MKKGKRIMTFVHLYVIFISDNQNIYTDFSLNMFYYIDK